MLPHKMRWHRRLCRWQLAPKRNIFLPRHSSQEVRVLSINSTAR